MHILLLYQYYHNPDCAATGRHYTFLRHLARNHTVTVLTTRLWHDRRITDDFPWAPPGVDVRMLPVPYDNRMRIARRAWSYARFALKSIREGSRVTRPDVIWGSSTPLTAAWSAYRLARSLRIPWVFEVRDLWPDFPIQMGAIPWPFVQNRVRALEKRMYASAAHVVTLSSDMREHVVSRGLPADRVTTLVNGTDLDLIDRIAPAEVDALRAAHGLAGKHVVLYAGSYGRANDIPTLAETVRLLSDRPDLHFVLAGHGYHQPVVDRLAAETDRVLSLPPQARMQALAWFKLADLSLVPFLDLPVLAANSPAKFFDSLGAGTPVIVTSPGWTRELVERTSSGWYAPAGDARQLADAISEVFRDPDRLERTAAAARRVARDQFDREALAGDMEAILLRAARDSSR